MKTRAAILWEVGKEWSVEEIDLDPPKRVRSWSVGRLGAVPLRRAPGHRRPALRAADHRWPRGRGHRRGGRARGGLVGPGDHVIFGFIPSCGRCPSCATGHSNLCDLGVFLGDGPPDQRPHGPPPRPRADVGLMCLLGTFSERTVVNEASCIKVDQDVPLDNGLPARVWGRDRLGFGGLRRRGRAR